MLLVLAISLLAPLTSGAQEDGTPGAIDTGIATEAESGMSSLESGETTTDTDSPDGLLPDADTVSLDESLDLDSSSTISEETTDFIDTDDEPAIAVSADSVQLDGEPIQSIGAGDSIAISLIYNVTTPRASTTVHAALVDDAGDVVDGWTLETDATEDTSALEPDTSFTTSFMVTAPEFVEIPHAVSFQLWSDVWTDAGFETGIEVQNVATITAEATPAHPAISCEAEGEGTYTYTCTVAPDRADVTGGSLTISGSEGWTFTANGVEIPQFAAIDLASVMWDGALSGSFTLVPDFIAGCADPAVQDKATVAVDYVYANAPAAYTETSITLEIPPVEPVAPGVSIAPPDFGELKRDGAAWGTTTGIAPITITREGCGDLGAYDVQVNVTGLDSGITPFVTTTTASGDGISAVTDGGLPDAEHAVIVAAVASDFSGTGYVEVVFSLTPDSSVPPGTYTMTIEVSTSSSSP